ncbi:MAG: MOSC domain-containing protein [Actinomycetota bacterium]
MREVWSGAPRTVRWRGEDVVTGIFKDAVAGRVPVGQFNVDGDAQADLTVHGGWEKAVYAYAAEDYAWWTGQRPDLELGPGVFGENLTVADLDVDDVHVGDRFRIGSTELVVTEPRLPCFKLGIKVGDDDFVTEFLEAGRYGFYLAVIRPGELAAGDRIERTSRHSERYPVYEIARLYRHGRDDPAGLARAAALDVVPESWRRFFGDQLGAIEASTGQRFAPPPASPSWSGYRPLEVVEKRTEQGDAATFTLADPAGEPLPAYRPGQFATLRLDVPGQPSPVVRSYSLSGDPTGGTYSVTIKRITSASGEPGVASGHLHDRVGVGDLIEVKAPAGSFTLEPTEHFRPAVLLGAGIGITPLLSMLRAIVAHPEPRETWVIHGSRNQADHVALDQLDALADEHPHVRLHVAHSRPDDDAPPLRAAVVHPGRVTPELVQSVLPASYFDYYLCGPAPMMSDLFDGLVAWGVPDHRIHYEAFGPATIGTTIPSEPVDPPVEVHFESSGRTSRWDRTDLSVLELAEASGIDLPFGCRAGSCGTCATTVVAGEVSYLHRPSAPIGPGQTLPCVAVPDGPLALDA